MCLYQTILLFFICIKYEIVLRFIDSSKNPQFSNLGPSGPRLGASPSTTVAQDVHPTSRSPFTPSKSIPGLSLLKVEISQKVAVDGEVNHACCMSQRGSEFALDLRLKGHDKEGYGLSWSPFKSLQGNRGKKTRRG